VTLDDHGVLFLSRPKLAAAGGRRFDVEIVAVQTPLPGLARSGWPMPRHDAAGTGWLGR
jgi:hypothetical protein